VQPRIRLPLAALAAGAVTLGYASLVERNWFTLRRFDVPVLAPGSLPLRVLHLSDLHLTAGQRAKQRWLRRLDGLEPDLVVNTGDTIAGADAIEPTLEALGPLLDRPGVFVFGNNDFYAPRPKNPLRYFVPERQRVFGRALPWRELGQALVAAGWIDATHARLTIKAGRHAVAIAGVDDPHLRRDRYDRIAGPADSDADVRLGLTHSPEPRIISRFATDGYDLILAGHTHGGQLRVPFYGALVTNCGIDRTRARWLHPWTDHAYLHVSAGLGTSPFAPVRFACRPEATLLTLTPATPDRPQAAPAVR
jgi:predicted MPP superfamily phosphohydrolase